MNPKDQSKDTLVGFEFKARDFQKVYGPGQGGPKDDLYLDFTTPGTEIGAIALAKHANDLLRERLGKAPKVYGLPSGPNNWVMTTTKTESCTHTARLIYIKPIKEEPSK